MKLLKRIEVLEDYIGRAIEVSRPAPPTWNIFIQGSGYIGNVPVYNEGVTVDRRNGTLSEILISASGTTLTLLNEDGEVHWTVTPDTSVTSIE